MSLRAVSLFSGIGMADLALQLAAKHLKIEVEIIAAYEYWLQAVKVYNANFSHQATVCDIRDLDILPDCDFVFGGPPCQPFSIAGKKLGATDPRDMMPKTISLISGRHYLIENVTRVINSPFYERLNASIFGDCTTRKRSFHSDLPLFNIPILHPPTTIKDIRDDAEDERIIRRRGLTHKAGHHKHHEEDEPLQSLTAHSWHGHDIRGNGKLMPIMLRGFSKNLRSYGLDEQFGSLTGQMWHGIEGSRLQGCRNPSILEMQRAHSIPEDFNWLDSTKTEKGKLIANSWPLRMGTSVFIAFLNNFL